MIIVGLSVVQLASRRSCHDNGGTVCSVIGEESKVMPWV